MSDIGSASRHHGELEAGAHSALAENKRKRSIWPLAIGLALIVQAALAIAYWRPNTPAPAAELVRSDETLAVPDVRLALPDPSATQPDASTTNASSVDQAELQALQQRIADLEAQKLRAEADAGSTDEEKWQRYRSPMVVSESSPTDGADLGQGEAKSAEQAEKSDATFQESNANTQFLGALSAKAVEVAKAQKNERIDALVPQGTMIRGVLETAVETDLPGMVRAVTTDDIWSFDGRRILIPAGSRIVGEYNAGLMQGQKRAFIVWTRLLRTDGVSLNLASPGTDELGVSGSGGKVDNHYLQRFGSAIMLTALSAGAQLAADPRPELRRRRRSGPITTITTDPATGKTTQTTIDPDEKDDAIGADLGGKGAAALAQGLSNVAQEALKSSIAIQPTIRIRQGTAVAIFVRRDLDFSDLYPDPVAQKLRELKRGGRGHGE